MILYFLIYYEVGLATDLHIFEIKRNSMKKYLVLLIAMLFALVTLVKSQESSFDKEASSFHKKAIMACMMTKAPSQDARKLADALNVAKKDLENLIHKYKSTPPPAYKNDPLWTSYFEDLEDNVTLVKTFTEQGNFKLASKYCNVFCRTFLRMHKNNGTVDLTDMLFSINMQMKLTTDILNAGNSLGTKENIDMVKKLIEKTSAMVKSSGNANFNELFVPFEKTAQNWITAIENSDAKKANELYGELLPSFKKIFMASM